LQDLSPYLSITEDSEYEELYDEIVTHLKNIHCYWLEEEIKKETNQDYSRRMIVKDILDIFVPWKKALLEEDEAKINEIINSDFSIEDKGLQQYFQK